MDDYRIWVELKTRDWVWLCEFLSQVIHEGELDPYEKKDAGHLLNILQGANEGEARKHLKKEDFHA